MRIMFKELKKFATDLRVVPTGSEDIMEVTFSIGPMRFRGQADLDRGAGVYAIELTNPGVLEEVAKMFNNQNTD
jgi:hypothetical protein